MQIPYQPKNYKIYNIVYFKCGTCGDYYKAKAMIPTYVCMYSTGVTCFGYRIIHLPLLQVCQEVYDTCKLLSGHL